MWGQDGWILAKFFFFACLWTETKSRPISSHLDRTNLVNKRFIIWLLGKFCLRDTAGSPERARWLHLACSGSQSQRVIWFILPARGARHIITQVMKGLWKLWCQLSWWSSVLIDISYHNLDWPSFLDLRELKKNWDCQSLGALKTLTVSLHHTPGRAMWKQG